MVGWFGGIHSLTTGQTTNAPQAGITLLLFSSASLRLAGLEMAETSTEWTYERLTTQIKARGWRNGIGVQCRIARLTSDYPVVTWPGDWLAFAVGDITSRDEGDCCSLVTTAWRPEAALRIEDAKEAFSNSCATHRLIQLGFPTPVRNTAATWLQKGTTSWGKDELEFRTALEQRMRRSGNTRRDATPAKEPKKRAAP
jgi:hypothetical protein